MIISRFYVYDSEPDSGDPGNAFGCYEAQTPDAAREAFMEEWDYPQEIRALTPLHIRKWRECETCGSTGLIPMPDDDPLREMYSDDMFAYFCPDCVLPEDEKVE